ncbi:MAG TPA: hypothetical protein VMH78_08490 [Thermoplasmata archaeon]|nr:hypothetical protein [Thermoplasmata archaeon]
MIVADAPGPIRVFGAVRGRVADVAPLLAGLEAFDPKVVGVGLSFDEMTGLTDHFAGRPFEPVVPVTGNETAEIGGLVRFGEVRLPHPAYVGVLEWAKARSVPVEPLEPSDETYATLFATHIGYVELVGRTLRERRLARGPPDAPTADEFAIRWDREVARGKGSRAFIAAREAHVATEAHRLAERSGRTAVVVDRERFDGVLAALRA